MSTDQNMNTLIKQNKKSKTKKTEQIKSLETPPAVDNTIPNNATLNENMTQLRKSLTCNTTKTTRLIQLAETTPHVVCRTLRELSNGGVNVSRNLNVTPGRPVQSLEPDPVHAVRLTKLVHAVPVQRFMALQKESNCEKQKRRSRQ